MRSSEDYFNSGVQEEFMYLPYLVIYMVLLYVCVSIFCGYAFDYKKKYTPVDDEEEARPENQTCCQCCCSFLYEMFCCCCCCWAELCCCFRCTRPLLYFDSMFESHCSLKGVLLLWVLRIGAFAFVVFEDLYKEGRDHDSSAGYQFINWVNAGVALYFLCAAIVSAWGLKTRIFCSAGDEDRVRWPIIWERFGALTLVLYESAIGNSVFIIIMQFAFFSHKLSLEQITIYIIPTACLMCDWFLNAQPCRLEHYYYVAFLPMAYLIFQWVTVYMNLLDWQSEFLQVKHATCFRAYSVMAGIHLGSYLFICILHTIRDRIFRVRYEDRHRCDRGELDEEVDVEQPRQTPITQQPPNENNTSNNNIIINYDIVFPEQPMTITATAPPMDQAYRGPPPTTGQPMPTNTNPVALEKNAYVYGPSPQSDDHDSDAFEQHQMRQQRRVTPRGGPTGNF